MMASLKELPGFGLIIPAAWTKISLDDQQITTWRTNALGQFNDLDQRRLKSDLDDFLSGVRLSGICRLYTHAVPSEGAALIMVFTVGIYSIPQVDRDDPTLSLVDFLATGGDGEDSNASMNTIERRRFGEYLRAERVLDESDAHVPWPKSREIRYLIAHPERDFVAVMTATTPNIDVAPAVQMFDTVASSFVWDAEFAREFTPT